jgi:ligand-binding sensor domain-containing protein
MDRRSPDCGKTRSAASIRTSDGYLWLATPDDLARCLTGFTKSNSAGMLEREKDVGAGISRWKVGLAACVYWLLAVTCFTSTARAQYRFDQWTADNGLPQNIVTAIHQTPDGYLWVATLDGLARFDGVRFTVFNKSNTPGLRSNRFLLMLLNPAGSKAQSCSLQDRATNTPSGHSHCDGAV